MTLAGGLCSTEVAYSMTAGRARLVSAKPELAGVTTPVFDSRDGVLRSSVRA